MTDDVFYKILRRERIAREAQEQARKDTCIWCENPLPPNSEKCPVSGNKCVDARGREWGRNGGND